MLVILGDYMIDRDIWLQTVRQSPECDAPIVRKVRDESRPGGAGAVSMMAHGLGAEVVDLGASIKAECIKNRHFLDGQQVYRLDEDHTTPITPRQAWDLVEQIPAEADIVLVADYGKGIVTDALWKALKTRTLRLIVDPSRDRPLDWYQGAYAIVPNRKEASVNSVNEAISLCHEIRRSCPCVCIKLDREGMVANGQGRGEHILAAFETATDVTGAGDMVLAAVGAGLEQGMDWLDACRFANQMAGLKCQQHGATPVVGVYLAGVG